MTSPVSIRFPDELRQRVNAIATQERRTFSQAALMLIEQGLLSVEHGQGPFTTDGFQAALKGRGGVTLGADPAGAEPPRPLSAPLDGAADPDADSSPESLAAPSSGGSTSRDSSPSLGKSRRSKKKIGAEPASRLADPSRRSGSGSAGEGADGTPESAPSNAGAEPAPSGSPAGGDESGSWVPVSESAPAPRQRRPRSGKCPHRVPAGTYCKRCRE